MTTILRTCSGLLLASAAAFAQTPAAPQFEVASIKLAPDLMSQMMAGKPPHVGMKVDGARVDIGAMSLTDLIRTAYNVKPFQVSGPAWMTKDRWDIMARIPEGVSKDLVPEMLQSLLANRFKLTIHRETKEHAEYALMVGKGGLKLKEAAPEDDTPPPAGGTTIDTGNGPMNIRRDPKGGGATISGPMGNIKVSMGTEGMHYEFGKLTMAKFAETLSQIANLPVVDMTELKGNYQVAFDIPMADLMKVAQAAGFALPGAPPAGDAGNAPANAASDPSGGNAIFESVQKLGLKLEQRKAPMETIVVDHLEKAPTDN